MQIDSELQFGILALQLGLIDGSQLAAAYADWSSQGEKSFSQVLADRGWLTVEGRRQVETMLTQHHPATFLPGDARLENQGAGEADRRSSAALSSALEPTLHIENGRAGPEINRLPAIGSPSPADRQNSEREASGAAADGRPVLTGDERQARYLLNKVHAVGGLGQIWLAWDEQLQRQVALKELSDRYDHSPQTYQRFLREAQITGQLEHPNIVPVYEVATETRRGNPFYVMRLLRGKTLRQAIDEFHEHRREGRLNPLELTRLLNAFIAICNAVAYAHSRGVVHRDLKPDNVVLGSFGEVVLLDWGLAKTTRGSSSGDSEDPHTQPVLETASTEATHLGSIMGTPAYMAPEQAEGRHDLVDYRTDVYGLGAILYCMLTGQSPHGANQPIAAVLKQIMAKPTPRVRHLQPQVAPALDAICAKAMARRPEDRYSEVSALADDVQRHLVDEPVSALPDSWEDRMRRWRRRHPAVVSGLSALFLTSVAALLLGLFLLGEEQAATDRARQLAERAQALSERRASSEAAARREAELARSAEAHERSQAEILAAEMVLRRGLNLCEQGNVAVGLLWFARGLQMIPNGAPELEVIFRTNLASWGRKTTPLLHVLDQGGQLHSTSYSADGAWVVTAGDDRTARLWDAVSGASLGEPLPHPAPVEWARFSPDKRILVTATSDGSVTFWDTQSHEQLSTKQAHQKPIRALTFSPDGATLVSASDDDTAVLWDVATRQPRGEPLRHQGHVWTAQVSPDGKWVATGGADRTVRLWDLATGSPRGEPWTHSQWVWAVAFQPDGKRLVSATAAGEVRFWDVATGKPEPLVLAHGGDVRNLAFSPDGSRLLTGSSDNLARLWDSHSGELAVPPMHHFGPIRAISFSPDGRRVMTGSMDNTARVWDAATGEPVGPPIEHQGQLREVAFGPDGQTMLTASADQTARIWDARSTPPLERTIPHGSSIQDLAVSANGQWLVTAGADQRARLWNSAEGALLAESAPQPGPMMAVGVDLATSRYFGAGAESWVRWYGVADGKEVGIPLEHPAPIEDLAWNEATQRLASGCWDGHLRIYDAATGSLHREVAAHSQRIRAVAFHPNGKLVATGSPDSTARIWNVETGEPASPPLPHDDQVNGLAFSPDGQWLATAAADKLVRLWEVQTGQLLPRSFQHLGAVRCVAFHPNGKQIITGGYDKASRRWDVATGLPVSPPWEHPGAVVGVAFLADEHSFVTACSDGSLRIWSVVPPVVETADMAVLWVEMMTGMQLTDSGFVRVLSAAEWRGRKDRWKASGR